MRVFLDPNVILSGIAFRGNEHAILVSAFSPTHEFVLSDDVRNEVAGVLLEKFPRLREEAKEILSLIRAETVPREDYQSRLHYFPALRDPADAHVLAAALVARCDLVVTGDKDLLALGRVEGLRIVKPGEALRLLRGSEPRPKTRRRRSSPPR